jgi:rhodanese-related sulfurtransferase
VSEAGRAVRQALALAALSVVIAAAVRFPLIERFARGEFSETFFEAAANPGIRLITLGEAEDLWREGMTVVLDARAAEPFDRGHVPGARNVPASDAGRDGSSLPDELLKTPRGMTLLVYCEGGDCQSSLTLSRRLHDEGFRDIRVFSGGWAAWTAAGLPEEKAETKGKGEKGDGQE